MQQILRLRARPDVSVVGTWILACRHWHCLYTPPPPWPSSSGSSLITASSSPVKISRPSLMLATGITFSVHPPALLCPHCP